MSLDLISLLVLALWTLPLNHIPAIARTSQAGVAWGMGNRDTMPDVPEWVGRADRAQRNHHDNLATIAIVILLAHVTHQTDGVTGIAAAFVVACRILHGGFYIAGIGPARSLCYLGSIVGLLAIVGRIIT